MTEETNFNMSEWIFGKPIVGFIGGYGSFLSAVLTVLGILTPLIGFVGCVFGTLAAYHSWRINRKRDSILNPSDTTTLK